MLGIDVGSMSAKVVLTDPLASKVLHRQYRYHRGQQAATVFDLLTELHGCFNIFGRVQAIMTGSGSVALSPILNAAHVQEVSAVAAAVENDFPEARAAIDLGGQDAKLIVWQTDPVTAHRRRFTNMNEKCAGGTGATLDRIVQKLGLDQRAIRRIAYSPEQVYPVSSKCGIFAETDINSLIKKGIPADACLVSICDAIVRQNLGTLTRGKPIQPPVVLLGGPHAHCPCLCQAWSHQLNKLWKQKHLDRCGVEPHVHIPDDAVFLAARGAILAQPSQSYRNAPSMLPKLDNRDHFITRCKTAAGYEVLSGPGQSQCITIQDDSPCLVKTPYPVIHTSCHQPLEICIGLDAGSTSTKAIAIDKKGTVVARAYRLLQGAPIDSAKSVLHDIGRQIGHDQGKVCSLVVTGYARALLQKVLGADRSIVETVAHAYGARQYSNDTDVILDVGGQDIKVLFLSQGCVEDFRLNTQCSAGNGFYLQNAAERFGLSIDQYAATALSARRMPQFQFGCAIFLEADIVSFQQQGWSPAEILAGLAATLPKNVWEYVVQEPSLGRRGKHFLLQGGAHLNRAVVAAQIDYIRKRVPDAQIRVHPFAGEAGALGAAFFGLHQLPSHSSFSGFDVLEKIQCNIRQDETMRCTHCVKRCQRIEMTVLADQAIQSRFILAPCEKGAVTDPQQLRLVLKQEKDLYSQYPNLVHYHCKNVFAFKAGETTRPAVEPSLTKAAHRLKRLFRPVQRNPVTQIGIPRTLNLWRYAPFFNGYLNTVLSGKAVVRWSPHTSERLWSQGSHYNCADLCFPGKYTLAHVCNLLAKGVDLIFNPALVSLDSSAATHQAAAACPVAMANPDVVKAALTTTEDIFLNSRTPYHAPVLHMNSPDLFDRQLFVFSRSALGASRKRHTQALRHGWNSYTRFYRELQSRAWEALRQLIDQNRVGILFLGHPYHYDPGLNHGVPEQLQKRGYPVFTIESLPRNNVFVSRLFAQDLAEQRVSDPFDIRDVWKHSHCENTNRKIWAAKVAARIPQLAVVDFLSFRCGPDAAVLHVIEQICRCSKTPYFTFHDMDQNSPDGSLNIRIETIDHYLKNYGRRLASGQSPGECQMAVDNATAMNKPVVYHGICQGGRQ